MAHKLIAVAAAPNGNAGPVHSDGPRARGTSVGYGWAFNQSMDACRTCIAYTGLWTPSESSLLM